MLIALPINNYSNKCKFSSLVSKLLLILLKLNFLKLFQPCNCLPDQVKIGILLADGQDEEEAIFRWSINRVNDRGLLSDTKLVGLVRRVNDLDLWDTERKTCELIDNGVMAIIGPNQGNAACHVGFICDSLDIPHFVVSDVNLAYLDSKAKKDKPFDPGSSKYSSGQGELLSTISVDLSISKYQILGAILDLLKHINTNDFIYLYEDDSSIHNFQEHFDGKNLKSTELNIRVVRFDINSQYRKVFWDLKQGNFKHMILDVKCKHLPTVLKQAQQVSMMSESHSYLITCPDVHTIDFEDFKYSRARILWFKIIDYRSESMRAFYEIANDNRISESTKNLLSVETFKTESALIHDAIEIWARTLPQIDRSQSLNSFSPLSCDDNSRTWIGSSIVNYLRSSINVSGMTGNISFSRNGERSPIMMQLMRLTRDGVTKIGDWNPSFNSSSEIRVKKSEVEYLKKGETEGLQRDTLIVTSIKNEPFFMNKQTTKKETGNSRYEGFAMDLIDELSRIVGFDYVFKEVDDGKYGKQEGPSKEWNGLIKEIMIGKADLAIADLSITSSREDAVDFTLPFMSTGISILFKKPTTKELELFSFLSPFEGHVWVYVCGAYVGVSSLLFIVGRISPYEWADPHPCRREGQILRNQFSAANSFWFTIAALMQQGSDLAPRSLSTRLIGAVWYFFTLIMISSYTANLAAFLTVEKVVYPIEKAEDLYRHPLGIKYGCVESGSTGTFFANSKPMSTFRKMYDEMLFVSGNDEGTAMVEKGNYAFFMESAAIDYKIERHCNLTQIGGLLDSKGYGIGIAKNSTRKIDYRTKLSEAILSLQESGVLEVLRTRWWKEKRGGGACDTDDSQSGDSVKELTLANVGGVFVVLLMGAGVAMILCGLELYERCRRESKASGLTKMDHLKRRLKFALSLSDNY